MIIFDLDGTLANCDHRKHFVDPFKNSEYEPIWTRAQTDIVNISPKWFHKTTGKKWEADWNSFYGACDKDIPIKKIIGIYKALMGHYDIEIWSGRSESVRDKTIDWLHKHLGLDFYSDEHCSKLRMRPIGNTEPDDEIKAIWLHDAKILEDKEIDFVFEDRPKVVRMWRGYGISVFNCSYLMESFE